MTSKREKILGQFILSLIIFLLLTILVWIFSCIGNNKIIEFTPVIIAMSFGYAVFLFVWGGISLIDKIRKRWQTPDGTIIESKHRHDFVSHTDKNAVDGGIDYLRGAGDFQDLKDLCVYSDQPFEIIRENHYLNCYITFKWLPLKDLKNEQIDLLISKNNKYKEFYIKEKEYRENEK